MESMAPAPPLTTALRILVRPAMIASAEKLYRRNITVEISSDAQSERGECSMWLNFRPARVSGLLIFGIVGTGEITWSARVHAKGEQVSSRAGELSRPDAAAEIFSIAKDFVKAFVTSVRV